MPYITKQNQAITADRNWLISKQYDARWSPTEKVRLKDIASRYKVKWSGNTRHVPGTRCLSVSTLFEQHGGDHGGGGKWLGYLRAGARE